MKSLPTSYTAARKWGIILLLALASLGAALLSMSFGSTQVPFSEILTALMGGETQAYNIVVYARLPRTLAALLCGSALAVGGVIIQGVLGNPLAGPNIIGVNAGAGLGAVLCAALIPTSMTAVPVAAFLGALGACMLVYTLARRTGASRITLVLAGDGPLLEPTKAQVQELGLEDCVKFIGFRKDIKNLYKGSDLYVNSSRHEALSFLIIEAMAAGLPVIATDMGGNSDIVNDEAGCGMLVEYDNPDSMAVAMKCFLEDPAFAARCRENARRTIEDKFEIHKMARATYGVYEKALHD